MNDKKLFVSLVLTISILMVQVGVVLAAPVLQHSSLVSGAVQSITLETDPTSGVTTTVIALAAADQTSQILRVSLRTAEKLGLLTVDADGKPVINDLALGTEIEVDSALIIPDEEVDRHPVGNALATFFPEIADYNTIMEFHNQGVGFGTIAQALWLTKKLGGDSTTFADLIFAKQTGDYSAFALNGDDTAPKNWGQLRKEILNGVKIGNLGSVMSNKDPQANPDPEKSQDKAKDLNKDQSKDKGNDKSKDKSNNGNGEGNDKGKKK
jgi:hypothetical protein